MKDGSSKSILELKSLVPENKWLNLAASYNNIGLVYMQKGELDKALEFYNKALEIKKEKAPNSLSLATSYNNIGMVYRQKGDAARAEEYLKKAEEIKRKAR